MSSRTVQAVAHTEPFSPDHSPCVATPASPDSDQFVPAPPITARTPGQRGEKVWIRPFHCSGIVMRLHEVQNGYLKDRHIVCRDPGGWVTLRIATVPVSDEAANAGSGQSAPAEKAKEVTPAGDDDYVWITPFWSGGFAVPTESLTTGLVDIPLRAKISDRGQVTFEHCLDPRRDWTPAQVSCAVAYSLISSLQTSRSIHLVQPFSVTGPDDRKWAHSRWWKMKFSDIPLQRGEPDIGLWDDPCDAGHAEDNEQDPYGCCSSCHDRIMEEGEEEW
ncbi:hypothetical protein A1Q1_03946 [Trichosporon asahii var. asahii CBS 2479]|uniref:Uncharacterized protein n=1 Tax=Trichosporon asahii var. asahii (strain ATCC 90039 / CBS 2479 / JCM 2466 / KCTC 7840 / NBRC 103889/ NCYC 2677 / UAMH 7654) TaxID=1186058 RepID=J6EWW5_TRIAS|nr:hypothetical protein A1Q1_03946 [Trichosporon asahii var. asahii CBS 2479]EJT47317.1 hypothetical protein A1Q1_03946 [Trichosporon asahii var. asahii CBS 2479]